MVGLHTVIGGRIVELFAGLFAFYPFSGCDFPNERVGRMVGPRVGFWQSDAPG